MPKKVKRLLRKIVEREPKDIKKCIECGVELPEFSEKSYAFPAYLKYFCKKCMTIEGEK